MQESSLKSYTMVRIRVRFQQVVLVSREIFKSTNGTSEISPTSTPSILLVLFPMRGATLSPFVYPLKNLASLFSPFKILFMAHRRKMICSSLIFYFFYFFIFFFK